MTRIIKYEISELYFPFIWWKMATYDNVSNEGMDMKPLQIAQAELQPS